MLIKGISCPECGEPYFGLPVCTNCAWKGEAYDEWCMEQLEIAKDFRGFLTKGAEKMSEWGS